VPSSEKHLFLKVRKRTIILPAKKYQNSLKRTLLRRKKLHCRRLIWPTRYKFYSHNLTIAENVVCIYTVRENTNEVAHKLTIATKRCRPIQKSTPKKIC